MNESGKRNTYAVLCLCFSLAGIIIEPLLLVSFIFGGIAIKQVKQGNGDSVDRIIARIGRAVSLTFMILYFLLLVLFFLLRTNTIEIPWL